MSLSNDQLKILLVEDNEGDYILVSEYLGQVLCESKLTRNQLLAEAKQSLLENKFDIVLLDISLPDSSGIDSIKDIIALTGSTPVIVLTGYNDRQFGIDSMKMGVQDYLIKDEVTAATLYKSISYSIERKKNEIQIAQNEKRFRALLENITDGLSVIDANRLVLEISPVGKKILGYGLETINQFPNPDIIHPEDYHLVEAAFQSVLQSPGQVSFSEFRIKLPNGKYKWVENTFQNLLNEPSVNAVVANYRDITERKNAEATIKDSEEKYRYLFNKNPQVIFIWDPQTLKLIDFNDTCIKLYGYTRDEFMDMTILGMRNPDDYERILGLARKMDSREIEVYIHTWKHKKKNGNTMYMDITAHRIIFNGKLAVLEIGNNVTEKVLLEKELEQEKVKKQQEITGAVINAQEKERREIGSELHDNVNQILASSKLYLGLAKKNTTNTTMYLEETEKLITSAIEELRNLSHSLIPPSLQESELVDAIEQVIATTAKTTKIVIKKDFKHFNENIYSDKMRLAIYRIVQEQFNNILKYAKASSIEIKLVPNEIGKLMLSIKDDGIGFDTHKKPRGIGLMNIKARASLFNGDSSVISSPGKGCELKILFN